MRQHRRRILASMADQLLLSRVLKQAARRVLGRAIERVMKVFIQKWQDSLARLAVALCEA